MRINTDWTLKNNQNPKRGFHDIPPNGCHSAHTAGPVKMRMKVMMKMTMMKMRTSEDGDGVVDNNAAEGA